MSRLIFFAFFLFSSPTLLADEVVLKYDDGIAKGHFEILGIGDIEVARFFPFHYFRLKKIELFFYGTPKEVEIHIWADNGGHQPDVTKEIIPPLKIVPDKGGKPTIIDVEEKGLVFEPIKSFHIGVYHINPSPVLLFDEKPMDEVYALVYTKIEGKKQWAMAPGDYLVRAYGEYENILKEFWFKDITEDANVAGGGRVAFGDYDGDGIEDLLVNGNRLFKNKGDGKFIEVSEKAKIGGKPTNGGIFGDYDNDGDLDFYATVNSLTEHDILWRNNGDGTFTDVSDSAGSVYDFLPTEAASWGDIDGDGFIDLYVANYEMPGEVLAIGTKDYLWRNKGDGTFEDISEKSGIRKWGPYCGRGVVMSDFDNDFDIDIYVSNYRLNPNFLWRNDGNFTMTDVAFVKGVQGINDNGYFGHSIGSVFGDIDNDLDVDIFVANLAHPRFIEFSDKSMLYENLASPEYKFVDRREEAGIQYSETHSEPTLFDFDNDSDLDLFITAVYAGRESNFYENKGGMKFEEKSYPSGLVVYNGWGAAANDINGDGKVDVIANRLFLNEYKDAGNYIKFKLEGTKTNRSAIGARVYVKKGEQIIMREIYGGKGTGNQDGFILHFGLGDAKKIENVKVRWNGGEEEDFGSFKINSIHKLIEGSSKKPLEEEKIEKIEFVEFEKKDAFYPEEISEEIKREDKGCGCEQNTQRDKSLIYIIMGGIWILLMLLRKDIP